MKINFKYTKNLAFQGTPKAIMNKNLRKKLKFSSPIDNLKFKNNNRYFNTNKKEEKDNSVKKLKILERNSEETKNTSKISNINISKINTNNSHDVILLDIMANKTIQPNHRHIPSNISMRQSSIKTIKNNYALNTFSNSKSNFEINKNINKFDMNKIITFTNTFFNSKTPKKIQEIKDYKKKNNKNKAKTNKFNSLNCFIDDYMSKKDHRENKKIKVNFKDYMGETEYDKLCEKEKTYLTEINKIKIIYKNTNLMRALCDYLNLSFVKLRNEKNQRMKTLNKERAEISKRNKYLKYLRNSFKYNLIPTTDVFNSTKKKSLNSTFNRNLFRYRNNNFSK